MVGAILSFQGKRYLWDLPSDASSRRPIDTISQTDKLRVLELNDAKYPSGYARSLTSKIQLMDKKLCGLKTHDCHVMFECLIPLFI